MKDPQHDDHCAAHELHAWKDWPAADDTDAEPATAVTSEVSESLYVIAKSDSVEHLYYREGAGEARWVILARAGHYARSDIASHPEPIDGFWMTLERAQELEQ